MRSFKSLAIQVAISAMWPSYLGLLAFAARVGPWPRSIARPAAYSLLVMSWGLLAAALARFLFGPAGWAESTLRMPPAAARQARRVVWALVAGLLGLLLPACLLLHGMIAPGDRPVAAPTIARLLILAFEGVVLVLALRVGRRGSPLLTWIASEEAGTTWIARHHGRVMRLAIALIAGIIGLEAQGYGFTARRLSTAAIELVGLTLACRGLHALIVRAIDHHAWRWGGRGADEEAPGAAPAAGDLAGKLERLSCWAVPVVGLGAAAWLLDVDPVLIHTIAAQPISATMLRGLTLGDLAQALGIAVVTVAIWRHLGTFFAVCVFPRMDDDPGVRFAALTLGRYFVLAVGMLASLSSIHLGLDKIGVGLAALGVGLGFGLQEIVSNFVSGLILLLERPIRVGDIVTVTNMSGRVERINIRATTIINADNQSLIVPNREFITGNLVNWTHQDRILRVNIPVGVAYGSDPDQVSELLLAIARRDPDVLRNPVPGATMEGFGESALMFALHVHVPDPAVAGHVKHRLCAEIQRRFKEAKIPIPVPIRELVVRPAEPATDPGRALFGAGRIDPGHDRVPAPMGGMRPAPAATPLPAEPSHRGMDE